MPLQPSQSFTSTTAETSPNPRAPLQLQQVSPNLNSSPQPLPNTNPTPAPNPSPITPPPQPVPAKKRRGRPPKPLSARKPPAPRTINLKPTLRQERSYSRDKKLQVITFLAQTKLPRTREGPAPRRRQGAAETDADPAELGLNPSLTYRDVTLKEASEFFKIPHSTIEGWWRRREDILQGQGRKRKGKGGKGKAEARRVRVGDLELEEQRQDGDVGRT